MSVTSFHYINSTKPFILWLFIHFASIYSINICWMPVVRQHSTRRWRDHGNKVDLSALQKLPGMIRQCCKCHEMQGGTHTASGRGLRGIWGGSGLWAKSYRMKKWWAGRRKRRYQVQKETRGLFKYLKEVWPPPRRKRKGVEWRSPTFVLFSIKHGP